MSIETNVHLLATRVAEEIAEVRDLAGAAGGYLGNFFIQPTLPTNGTSDSRSGFEAAYASAVTLANLGGNVVIDLPAGVFSLTSVSGTVPNRDSADGGGAYSNKIGIGLTMNTGGHITFRGRGAEATVFKLSDNARNFTWWKRNARYDVFQNHSFEGFTVDNNSTVGRCHIVTGNLPDADTPQRYCSVENVHAKDIKVKNVPFDFGMATTKKTSFVFRGRHAGNYEAGVVAGTAPLKPFNRATATADGYTFALNVTMERVHTKDARAAIQVVCDITQETSHYVDGIRYEKCSHIQDAPYGGVQSSTSFYIGGNCVGGRGEIIDCISVNVGDDSIEYGGLQELYVRNFLAVNPVLDAILVRYTQPPIDAAATRIEIDGLRHVITAEALGNDTYAGTSVRRSHRGRTWEVTMEDDAATSVLGKAKLRNVTLDVQGGYYASLNGRGSSAGSYLGFRHSGGVQETVIEDLTVIVRNMVLDYSSGTYITSLFSTVAGNSTATDPTVTVRRFKGVMENITSSGAGFELRALAIGGRGTVDVDGADIMVADSPSTAVIRAAIASPGTLNSTDTSVGTSEIRLNRLSGRTRGTTTTVRRGVHPQSGETFEACFITNSDFRVWANTLDIDLGSAGGNGNKVLAGEGNLYQAVPNGGLRNPQAADYTMRTFDRLIAVTSTSATRTITLPSLAQVVPGVRYRVIDESNAAGTNNITIARAGTDTFIGGATSKTISTNGGALAVYSNGTNWVAEPVGTSGSSAASWGSITGTLSDQSDLNTALAAKAPTASPAFTGNPTAPTATAGDNDTTIATTAFVTGAVSDASTTIGTLLAAKAPLASPALTGNPTAPTPSAGDNDTSVATTAFVAGEIAAIPAASTTVQGKVELATTTEATAGTDTTRAVTPAGLAAYTPRQLVLEAADPIPGGTPANTVIFRKGA